MVATFTGTFCRKCKKLTDDLTPEVHNDLCQELCNENSRSKLFYGVDEYKKGRFICLTCADKRRRQDLDIAHVSTIHYKFAHEPHVTLLVGNFRNNFGEKKLKIAFAPNQSMKFWESFQVYALECTQRYSQRRSELAPLAWVTHAFAKKLSFLHPTIKTPNFSVSTPRVKAFMRMRRAMTRAGIGVTTGAMLYDITTVVKYAKLIESSIKTTNEDIGASKQPLTAAA